MEELNKELAQIKKDIWVFNTLTDFLIIQSYLIIKSKKFFYLIFFI
jgi:hypothetical protein